MRSFPMRPVYPWITLMITLIKTAAAIGPAFDKLGPMAAAGSWHSRARHLKHDAHVLVIDEYAWPVVAGGAHAPLAD